MALRAGRLVLVTSDTVMGVAAAGSSAQGVEALRHARGFFGGQSDTAPSAWHAADGTTVADALGHGTPLLRRAMERLWPGPVTFLIEIDGDTRRRVAARTGLLESAGVTETDLLVRVPGHPVLRQLAAHADVPIIAEGVRDHAGFCSTPETARAALKAAGIESGAEVLGDPQPIGRPSTLVRFPMAGGYRILAEGAMPAAEVHRRLHLRVLFVCTGNTCRSPMAELIARHLSERQEPGSVPIDAASAGIAAGEGEPPTPEATTALETLGVTTHRQRSKPAAPELIASADAIFAMTAAHVAGLRARAPEAAARISTLDPTGRDVPDPIGGSQRLYDETARRLMDLIASRLKELQS